MYVFNVYLLKTKLSNTVFHFRYFKADIGSAPEKIREFKERPRGIIAKNVQIKNYPDCKELEIAIENQGEPTEVFEKAVHQEVPYLSECLNDGELIGELSSCNLKKIILIYEYIRNLYAVNLIFCLPRPQR